MRNYKKERENYHSRPEQMVRNAARKRARRWMEREGKAKAGDGKDVHHKDNNPLNNDKNNLSLVTQHYNRREPRLRQEDVQEMSAMDAKKMRMKVAQAIQISGSAPNAYAVHQSADAMRTSTRAFQLHFQKQKSDVRELIAKAVNKMMDKKAIFFIWDAPFAKMITAFGEEVNEANAISMSNPNAKRMIGLMQKYFNTKDKNKKAALLKDINKYQKMFGLKVSEDMGTVTGTHIAGTGDDSSTVKVRKKKKVRRRKNENMTDWEKRDRLSRQVRQAFWKSLKGNKKKDVNVKFKLKNSKSLRKRIIDNVLAIQQKV